MSATLSIAVRPVETKRPGAWFPIFTAWREEVAGYLVRRATIATLRKLDDRVLWDIGLARSQIEPAAHGFMTAARTWT